MKSIAALILISGFAAAHAQDPILDLAKAKHDVFIAGRNQGEITKEELLNANGLEPEDTSHYISGFGMNILEHEMDSSGRGGMLAYGLVAKEGNQFTKEMRRHIEALPPGSSISIHPIYCYEKYKGKHYVGTLYFEIK